MALTQSVSYSVSDKGTYRAVRGQLKIFGIFFVFETTLLVTQSSGKTFQKFLIISNKEQNVVFMQLWQFDPVFFSKSNFCEYFQISTHNVVFFIFIFIISGSFGHVINIFRDCNI